MSIQDYIVTNINYMHVFSFCIENMLNLKSQYKYVLNGFTDIRILSAISIAL